ncbi:MAG: hypothetical protein JNJ47_05125 [Alphaproteobacteria bacterium]|nr:hypothetical protein [Alphaproteobacteria bacterium]
MTFTKILSMFIVVMLVFLPTAFSMIKKDFEDTYSSPTVIHIKNEDDERTPIIKKEIKKEKYCKDCDMEYWGFIHLLGLARDYFAQCQKDDTVDHYLSVCCCPFSVGGWLIAMPFSCLACCCCCPNLVEDCKKDFQQQRMKRIKNKESLYQIVLAAEEAIN